MRAKIPKPLWRLPLLPSPYFNFMLLLFLTTIFAGLNLGNLVEARLHRRAQELYEVRVFEGAPIGTKATLNEAFDRALREMNSCFAQLESDLDWLDFDSDRLFFQTVAELPQNSSRPAQFAVLHLLCPQHKHSLHFSVHITRRNRHAPKFLSNDYRFYAPVNLPIGSEIGKVQVQDQDPIIYNSQVQLSIVRSSSSPSAFGRTNNGAGISSQSKSADLDEDPFWEIARNGSIIVRRRLGELRLFRPYQLRLLAIDFGSPQLFSLTNVTIVPVSVSQPQNVRVNIANTRYQVFQWELPVFGVPEQFRLTLRRKGELRPIYEGELEPTETMAMTRIRLPIIAQMEVSISAVDVDGETPSEGIPFQALESELLCEGQCAGADAGLPMCHYSQTHQLEQFRDAMGQRHCLCFAGFSGAQCDRIEHCPSERLLEHYGGVDWPETAVNQSAGIPCPYNDDGRRLERKCGWNAQREEANWANATNAIGGGAEGKIVGGGSKGGRQSKGNGLEVGENDGHCRTQSSVLVHLGVLANYGQRSEQTLSGLHSVMRFLNTLLQFPAFQPQIPSAHFDAKIAEHVAQVLDSLAARNLSSLTGSGNSTQLSGQVAEYAKEFARRLPVPFSLQSASGGLQMRAWDLLPSAPTAADTLDDPIAGNGQGGVQLGPCFVQPPPQPRPRTARAICLRNATLFPLLNGHSPLLMLQIDDGRRKSKLNGSEERMEAQSQQQQGGPIVLGFRLPKTTIMPSKLLENFTCAQFDQQAQLWSASGIAVLSREFRPHGQILLCEVDSMIGEEGIFALLPESMFRPESALLVWFAKYGTALGAVLTMVICLALLLSSAFLHRNSDPALLVLLLSLLLLHLFHFVFLLRPQLPQLPFSIPWPPSSSALFSALQLALLSFVASMALINSSIYTRIVHLELEIRKAQSRGTRLLLTLLFTIFLPLALCVLTSLLDGQILIGLDSDAPYVSKFYRQLQPFNWTFGLALLLPLVLFMGCAMGFGAYSFWYGNKLASSSTSDWPMESASLIQRRLLHQLSCAGGLSWLVLIFPLANLLALLLPPEPISSLVLCVLYFFTALFLLLFVRLLARIHRRLPYARENITNGIEQGPRALRENTLVAPLDEKKGKNGGGFGGGRNGTQHGKQQPVLIIQEQGQAQPIAPGEVLDPNNNSNNTLGSPMADQGLDRQFLLRRAIHPAQLQSQPPLLIGTQFRQQLGVPSASNQQRLSGTVSTSAGTVLLESDDLASLDRAIAAQTQLVPMQNSTRNLPANLFAEMDGDEEEEDEDDDDEEDLDAFLEPHGPTMGGGEMSLRPPQQKQRKRSTNGASGSSPNNLAHPLVSVV